MRELINYLNRQKLSKAEARKKLVESENFVKEKGGFRTVIKEAMSYWVMKNGDLLIDGKIKCIATIEYSWNGKYWQAGIKNCNDIIYNKFSDMFDVSLSDGEIAIVKNVANRKKHIQSAPCWSWPDDYTERVWVTFANGTLLLKLESRKFKFFRNKFFKRLNAIYILFKMWKTYVI